MPNISKLDKSQEKRILTGTVAGSAEDGRFHIKIGHWTRTATNQSGRNLTPGSRVIVSDTEDGLMIVSAGQSRSRENVEATIEG